MIMTEKRRNGSMDSSFQNSIGRLNQSQIISKNCPLRRRLLLTERIKRDDSNLDLKGGQQFSARVFKNMVKDLIEEANVEETTYT